MLDQRSDVLFEKQSSYPVQLSLDALASQEVHEAIIRIAGRIKTKAAASLPVAKSISLDQLDTQLQEVLFIWSLASN